MQAYALKAAREGKQETSWLNPNQAYEAGLRTFIERILDPAASAEFLDSIGTLAKRVALLGALNSLSQITLKATMPGVPDFYQGTEFWDLSLVDPDNRRPVDFAARAAALPRAGKSGLGRSRAALAGRPYQAGLDPPSVEAARPNSPTCSRTAIISRSRSAARTATMSSPLHGAAAATP